LDFAEKENTLPKLLRRNYLKYGLKVGIREKKMGIWQNYSWAEYYERVKHLCLSFISMGLMPGDRVSILAENKPHAYWFELAVHSNRGVVVGVFADCTPSEVEYYVVHSESRFVVCQDQEQVDKVLEIKNRIPDVQKIIYWDPKGLWNYSDPLLINMDQMIELGKSYEREHPNLFEEKVSSTKENDLALFFYSSGTTGKPKAAMVTHQVLIGMAEALNDVDHFKEHEEYLSFLPIAWISEQLAGVGCSLVCGLRTNFPEKPETVQENIREIGPHFVFFGPRLWESLIRTIQVKILNSDLINRLFYNAALRIGYRTVDYSMSKKRPSFFWSLLYLLADKFVFRPLRDNLGLNKTHVCYTGGAALSPDVIKYFHAIGVNVKQVYGSSEIGTVACHRNFDIKPETCGPPLSNVDIKISDNGEILVRTPNMFSGYYKEEEKTAKAMSDGWYHTGDFGFLDKDGHLIVMDRMDDLLTLAGGHKFSPQFCEIQLRFSPYIKDVLAIARENETFIGALVNIDLANVGQWAEVHQIPYTTFSDLSQKPQVIDLVRQEIVRINGILPNYSRIKKFINLHKEFDPDEAEMTRTRKLRRTFVEERFSQMVEAIFSDKEELEVISQITYQDGRISTTKSVVEINQV
jgi:long-chain acyl-CoA synthetase